MATLPYKEYFGRNLYGQLGPDVTYPDLIGPGILGRNMSASGLLDGSIACPPGTSRDASGQCVKTTGVTSDGGCPHGFLSDGKGGCTTANTCPGGGQPPCDEDDNGGAKTCAQKGLCPDGAGGCKDCNDSGDCPNPDHHRVNGVCVPKTGSGPTAGCPEGWKRDRWGTCRPIHHIESEGPDFTHVGGIENALKIAQDCRWGRNPHTDQCNPNPTFGQDAFLGSPTALGGLPRDTGSGSSAYISGAGLEALDRGLYPSGFVPQSGILSGPEDMFSDGAYMGGSILDMANAGAPSYGEEMFRGQAINPRTVSTSMTPSYGEEAFGGNPPYVPPIGTGPSASDLARIARADQEAEDARREQDAIRMNIAPPVTAPAVTNILDNVITQDTDWVQKALDEHREMQERDRKWREEQMKGQYSFF
tara:strand:- start:6089 stop:7342 length:1254 start_codon:yes stop_codon:yes gene_type:complete